MASFFIIYLFILITLFGGHEKKNLGSKKNLIEKKRNSRNKYCLLILLVLTLVTFSQVI